MTVQSVCLNGNAPARRRETTRGGAGVTGDEPAGPVRALGQAHDAHALSESKLALLGDASNDDDDGDDGEDEDEAENTAANVDPRLVAYAGNGNALTDTDRRTFLPVVRDAMA